MKRIIFTAMALVSLTVCSFSQELQVKQDGKNFIQVVTPKKGTEPINTGFTFTDTKGKVYPVMMSSTGACFIIKTSKKTGNDYRMYLGEDVSKKICSSLGKEYKPTNKK